MNYLIFLALLAGIAIAVQASLNAQLGVLLKNPLLAAYIAFCSSMFFSLIMVLGMTKEYPSIEVLRSIPGYLWFSGGLLSAFAISMFYFLIPKMGLSNMISFALTGQLLLAVVASHFGWFDLPVRPIDGQKILGVMGLLLGIVLINGA